MLEASPKGARPKARSTYNALRGDEGESGRRIRLRGPRQAFNPFRIEYHPVAHVGKCNVDNGTGWNFRGWDQSCVAFKPEYNLAMSRVKDKCEAERIPYEVLFL